MTWLDYGSDSPAYDPTGSCARLAEIEVDVSPDTTTVVIHGELDLVSMAVLAARLAVALRRRPRRLVLDMAGTTFMDCACARMLASAAQFVPEFKPVIRQPGPAVRRILQLTELDACFEIEELPRGRVGSEHERFAARRTPCSARARQAPVR
jgi:anti-anti-sigma factor